LLYRELRRSAVKAWLGEDTEEPTTSSKQMKLTPADQSSLEASGLNLEEITVYKFKKEYGYTYKSKQRQVVIHGENEENNFGEILYILQRKSSESFFLLLQDLDVTFVQHLGLHVCTRACSRTLLKIEHLISSCPLNMYTAENHLKQKINFVSKHEALVYD
jgi:hypothetical protein